MVHALRTTRRQRRTGQIEGPMAGLLFVLFRVGSVITDPPAGEITGAKVTGRLADFRDNQFGADLSCLARGPS